MTAHEKVMEIFREMAGAKAERLSATHFPADVNSRVTAAIVESKAEHDILAADHIGFHIVDWHADAAFLVALSLYPERFSDEEVRDGVGALLSHVPAHVLAAARLSGSPIPDLIADEKKPNKAPEPTTPSVTPRAAERKSN
jgi:hypothetical protein